MKDRFDFEQDIYQCWHIIDDLKQLTEMVLDRDASTDDIANILLGLQTLYDDRFEQLMESLEYILKLENTIAKYKKQKEMDEKLSKVDPISSGRSASYALADEILVDGALSR